MTTSNPHSELRELLDLYCENQISSQQAARLEQLARIDRESLQFYLDYVELHGNLIWDLAAQAQPHAGVADRVEQAPVPAVVGKSSRVAIVVAVACLALIAFTSFVLRGNDGETEPAMADNGASSEVIVEEPKPRRSVEPLDLESSVVTNDRAREEETPEPAPATTPLTDSEIVAQINLLVRRTWDAAEVTPSPVATEDAWTRRAYLDIVGRIPTSAELQASRSERGRLALVHRLLAEPGYARFWSANWTNLLIGRSSERGVNRAGFDKFLRDRFASNAPWNETVGELIAAEGTTEENGATNFLVAHLNSQAVPATAVTARVFLGLQVQCTQCHDHPFNTELKQDQFWTLNSFFKQTKRERRFSERIGPEFVLTSTNQGGPTHYETRSGLVKTAFPAFGGQTIDAGEGVNRRKELARILTLEDNDQLARSMVNRVWAHFFGYGFTSPIDDMGPHNSPTHPDLLNLLSSQFRLANFDIKRLITWIVLSEAYGLDSAFADNVVDAPSRGEMPLFSRMYVRSMSPEQVYDSLLIATQAHQKPGFDWATARERRHDWIQQFLFAHGNEENTEASTFNGSITQAMSLMNSGLVEDAVSTERGTLLSSIIGKRTSPTDQLTAICRAVLSRDPSDAELAMFRKLLRNERTAAGRTAVLQDVLWAYLNSNEFILVH